MIVYFAHYEPDLTVPSNNVDDRPGFKVISTYILENGAMSDFRKFYTQAEYDAYVEGKELEPAWSGADIITVTFNPKFSKLPDVKTQIPLRWSNKKFANGWVPR